MILVSIIIMFIIIFKYVKIWESNIHFIINPANGGKPAKDSKFIKIRYLLEFFINHIDWLDLLFIGNSTTVTIIV